MRCGILTPQKNINFDHTRVPQPEGKPSMSAAFLYVTNSAISQAQRAQRELLDGWS